MKFTKEDIQQILEDIALEELGFEKLGEKGNDSEDFKEVSKWGVKAALEAAYNLGLNNRY